MTKYYRFMTSDWIQRNAEFECNINKAETNEKQLSITTDARDYERIFRLHLLGNKDDLYQHPINYRAISQ